MKCTGLKWGINTYTIAVWIPVWRAAYMRQQEFAP